MKRLKVYIVLILVIVVASCKDKSVKQITKTGQEELYIIHGTLGEAILKSKINEKRLLVITKINGCDACTVFFERIEKDRFIKEILNENFMVYICDLSNPNNQYLPWIMGVYESPYAIIFNSEGKIENIHSGLGSLNKLRSFFYAVEKGKLNDHFFNNRLNMKAEEAINYFNINLNGFEILRKNKVSNEDIKDVLRQLKPYAREDEFFFSCYLTSKLYSKLNDKVSAKVYAEKALSIDDYYSKKIYGSLYKELNHVIY